MPHRSLFAAAAILALLTACNDGPDEAAPAPVTPPAGSMPAGSAPDPETLPADLPANLAGGCGAVRAAGYCGVMFGMSADEAITAFPGGLEQPESEPGMDCAWLNPSADDYDLGFMAVDGTVMRLDVRGGDVATAEGAAIGSGLDELRSLYPNAEEQPNKYTGLPDIFVTVESGNRLVFETGEDGTVTRYRAGMSPAVDYVEGCS